MQSTSTDFMGSTTTLVITNCGDQVLAARGVIPDKEVRSVTLKNVLVDSGATTLCLSANVIFQLGLSLLKEVDVATATEFRKARIFEDAKIFLCERIGIIECSEILGGTDSLVGMISLKTLEIELDL